MPLTDVMEEADAELIQRVLEASPEEGKAIFDVAFYLHMDQLFKRLAAGMMAGLNRDNTKKMVEESRKSALLDEAEVSG